jgi:hypothetical protein
MQLLRILLCLISDLEKTKEERLKAEGRKTETRRISLLVEQIYKE